MERGCYFLRTLPPEELREPPEELREPLEEPRDADPELRADEPRETLADFPDEDEPTRALPAPEEELPVRLVEGLSADPPEDGRETGPENVRARARPPSP